MALFELWHLPCVIGDSLVSFFKHLLQLKDIPVLGSVWFKTGVWSNVSIILKERQVWHWFSVWRNERSIKRFWISSVFQPRLDFIHLLYTWLCLSKFVSVFVDHFILLLEFIKEIIPALLQLLIFKFESFKLLHLFVLDLHLFIKLLIFSLHEIELFLRLFGSFFDLLCLVFVLFIFLDKSIFMIDRLLKVSNIWAEIADLDVIFFDFDLFLMI